MERKNTMKSIDITERLGVTRARIEAAASGPSVLAVTSALASDGSGILASALAESFTRAGHSVLLITTDGTTVRKSTKTPVHIVGKKTPALLELSINEAENSYSLESARTAFARYRDEYAFTIIDASAAGASGSALSFASAADFVLIAFEDGRSARNADRELAKNLLAAGASLLGVVTIDRKTLNSFETLSAPPATTSYLRPVHNEELPKRNAAFSTTTG
jgi:Mrp family chromosome partitioning ATPase